MNSNIQDNHSFLNQLEWDLFKEACSTFSLFKNTPNQIFSKPPQANELNHIFDMTDLFLAPEHYEEIVGIESELRQIDENKFPWESGAKLQKGVIFELEELSGLVRMLEIVFWRLPFFSNLIEKSATESVHDFKKYFTRSVLKEFRSFVTAEGIVDYFKHPKLKSLYKEQIEIETSIRSTLAHLRQSDRYQKVIQFESHDIINDKYVLPVKSDAFNSSLGIIVARSESGRTLYVEPEPIKNQNRSRFEIILKIDQIIHEIARDFCARLAPWGSNIDALTKATLAFDEYRARARFALEKGLSRPSLVDTPMLSLNGFFHPLISDPVKNDLNLNPRDKGLVISGPNTGGKTAAIKAIALTLFFVKHGLFAPARQAEIHLFENIFYFGNDQQSLPEGLSSFSAEVKNYSQLFENLGKSNLVIIDEIFNSTSSEEASALALALFNELTSDEFTKVIVSTHHQTLKTLAHSQDEYVSCHVGFDSEKNEPTYKLVYGVPGSSLALEVFRKLSRSNPFSEKIYKKALKKLDNKMINYEKMLQSLSLKESKLNNLLRSNEELRKELKSQKESARGLVQLKVKEEVEKVKKELSKVSAQANSLLDEIRAGKISNKNKVHQKLSSMEAELAPFKNEKADLSARVERFQNLKKPEKLAVGEKYFCGFVNQVVTLLEIKNKKEALVSKGALKIKCPLDSLRLANSNHKNEVVVTTTRSSDAKLEYDCRGMRLSEFQNLVENVTPELIAGNLPFINLIHGHGDGILKKWIRDYIKSNNAIEWDRTETGNDGETRLVVS